MFCLQAVTQSLLSYLPPSELHTAYILTWSMCAAGDTAADGDNTTGDGDADSDDGKLLTTKVLTWSTC